MGEGREDNAHTEGYKWEEAAAWLVGCVRLGSCGWEGTLKIPSGVERR
jgi:hypothetical protein